jgi:DNA repair protein RadC
MLTEARKGADIRRIAEAHGLTVRDLANLASCTLGETRAMVGKPAQAADVCADMAHEDQECLVVLLLDTRNRLLERVNLYRGNVNTSVVRLGEVYRLAVIRNAPGIIMLHNHPSGDPTPSPEDLTLTRAAREAGRLLDIELLDHVIIGREGHISIRATSAGGW